jgi:hypothetical protein
MMGDAVQRALDFLIGLGSQVPPDLAEEIEAIQLAAQKELSTLLLVAAEQLPEAEPAARLRLDGGG